MLVFREGIFAKHHYLCLFWSEFPSNPCWQMPHGVRILEVEPINGWVFPEKTTAGTQRKIGVFGSDVSPFPTKFDGIFRFQG